jgi:hypothetical protein
MIRWGIFLTKRISAATAAYYHCYTLQKSEASNLSPFIVQLRLHIAQAVAENEANWMIMKCLERNEISLLKPHGISISGRATAALCFTRSHARLIFEN